MGPLRVGDEHYDTLVNISMNIRACYFWVKMEIQTVSGKYMEVGHSIRVHQPIDLSLIISTC